MKLDSEFRWLNCGMFRDRFSAPQFSIAFSEGLVMGKSSRVALDSNCYTYLIEALEAGDAPKVTDALRLEKLALVRTMLYDEWGLYITPKVTEEYLRIRAPSRSALHKSWSVLFTEVQPIDPRLILERIDVLSARHSDRDDCTVLAEAADARLKILLTYDSDFIAHLSRQTDVEVMRPSDYWERLNVPKGAKPRTFPHSTNPLGAAKWWRWE